MRYSKMPLYCLISVAMVLGAAAGASAQDETSTEIYGFYQGYRNFDYRTGIEEADILKAALEGGGFGVAQNLASWFALWTQFSFFGSVESPALRVRVISNLQGVRYQTRQYGPFRLYGKGGVGFTNFSIDTPIGSGGETKLSLGYGGGVQAWITDYLGLFVDGSHLIMGVPNLTDLEGRDKWDSGLAMTAGFSVRF
ncbi:MAG: hypothetical protein JW793_13785 [Acidobacteria bacterium]|nr:hypothetical protein [Acidobacteriota bacterium]